MHISSHSSVYSNTKIKCLPVDTTLGIFSHVTRVRRRTNFHKYDTYIFVYQRGSYYFLCSKRKEKEFLTTPERNMKDDKFLTFYVSCTEFRSIQIGIYFHLKHNSAEHFVKNPHNSTSKIINQVRKKHTRVKPTHRKKFSHANLEPLKYGNNASPAMP